MKRLGLTVGVVLFALAGCGIQFDGKWDVSGEFFPGNPFALELTIEDGKVVSAHYSDYQGKDLDIVICDLQVNDETQEFTFFFNPFVPNQNCESLKDGYLVQGRLGYASLTGEIKDKDGKVVGRFRGMNKKD